MRRRSEKSELGRKSRRKESEIMLMRPRECWLASTQPSNEYSVY